MQVIIIMLLLALASFAQKDSLIKLTDTTTYDSNAIITNVTMLNIDTNAKSIQLNGYDLIKYKLNIDQTFITSKYWVTNSLIHIYDRNMFKIGYAKMEFVYQRQPAYSTSSSISRVHSTTVDILGNDIPAYITVEHSRECAKEYPYNDSLKSCTTNPTCTDSQYSTIVFGDFGYEWKCNDPTSLGAILTATGIVIAIISVPIIIISTITTGK